MDRAVEQALLPVREDRVLDLGTGKSACATPSYASCSVCVERRRAALPRSLRR
jgi:hypothetical protein